VQNHRVVTATAFLGLSLVLLGPLTSCVEIRITTATVVAGPAAGGALTIQLGATLTLEEDMQNEEDTSEMEPTRGAIGYLAIGLPAKAAVTGARLSGPATMVGEDGTRAMGEAPQLARIYATEFPADGVEWVAFHVILDEVDLRQPQAVTLDLDLTGMPAGVTPIWVAPGSIDDATTQPVPNTPTQLELAVGGGKATIRVVPPALPAAGQGVQA